MSVKTLIKVIDDLDASEQRKIVNHVRDNTRSDAANAILDQFKPETQTCPDCESPEKVKHGIRAGRQRYKCKDCGRFYTELTNTPLEGLKKSLQTFVEFLQMTKDGFSCEAIGRRCGISPTTAYNWRDKVMDFFANIQENYVLGGIIEVDETYLLHSFKGQPDKLDDVDREPRERGESAEYPGLSFAQDCILTLQDRNGNTFMKKTGRGRPGFDDINLPLSTHAKSDSVICTDGMNAYDKFVGEYGIERKRVKKTDKTTYHLQNVNNLHNRFKDWLKNFNGVSTKHLNKYLGFFSAVHT